MRAIVTYKTDETNVYAYLDVQPLTADGRPASVEELPAKIDAMMRDQWPSSGARGLQESMDEAAAFLAKLGWSVLDGEGDPYGAGTAP